MNEALLQLIWKHKLLGQSHFTGTKNEAIEIQSIGEHNQDSGPDFFNSKVCIDGVLLAGNVELHIKTSDWLKHQHQKNKAYDNLVLHVVYEHDVELQQNREHNVSVVELKAYIKPNLIEQYKTLQNSQNTIACGKSIAAVPSIIWKPWLDRLAVSRLETKTDYIEHLFEYTQHNFEDTLYILLSRNFGFKINNEAFELLAKSLPYSTLKKYANNQLQLEALLYGTAGFLDEPFEDDYPKLLQNEFEFLKHKHQLIPLRKDIWKFAKTRPVNFPTIRLSQLAGLINKQQSLFHLLETKPTIKQLRDFFDVGVSLYWQEHFKFDVKTDASVKPLGDTAFQIIVINTIVPFLFFYAKKSSNEELSDYALELLSNLSAEDNIKTKHYSSLGITIENALESQALIQLYDSLCSKKACLNCRVAEYLLKRA